MSSKKLAYNTDYLLSLAEVEYTELKEKVMYCTVSLAAGKVIITGVASCVDPQQYDSEKAKAHALQDATNKLRQMENYRTSMNGYVQHTDTFDFGTAITLAKIGDKVARKGWNGADMFIYYVPAASYPIQRNNLETLGGTFPDDMAPYREYLALKTAQNDIATWAPSCSDALAEDWYVVESIGETK